MGFKIANVMLQAQKSPFSTMEPRRHQLSDDRADVLISRLFQATAKGSSHRTAKGFEWLRLIEHVNPSLFILTDRQLDHFTKFTIANQDVDMSIEEITRLIRQVKNEVPSTEAERHRDLPNTYDDEELHESYGDDKDEGEQEYYNQSNTPNYFDDAYAGPSQPQQQPNPFLAALYKRHQIPHPIHNATADSDFFEDRESINHPDSASFQLPLHLRKQKNDTGSQYDQLTELNLLKRDKAELSTRIREFNMKMGRMEQEIEDNKKLADEWRQKEQESQETVQKLRNLVDEYETKLLAADKQMTDKDEEIAKLKTERGSSGAAAELFDETQSLYDELERKMNAHNSMKATLTEEINRLKSKIRELEASISTLQNENAFVKKEASAVQGENARLKKDLKKVADKYKAESLKSKAEVTELEEKLKARRKSSWLKTIACICWWLFVMFAFYMILHISLYVRMNDIRPGAYKAPNEFINVIGHWLFEQDTIVTL